MIIIFLLGAFFCVVCAGIYFIGRSKITQLSFRHTADINHIAQILKETEHHRDILSAQNQQKDQKIDHLQSLITDVSSENSHQKTEIEFLKEIKEKSQQQRVQLDELLQENSYLKATLIKEQQQAQEKINLLGEAEQRLSHQFKVLSSEILSANSQSFLTMANEQLKASFDHSQTKMVASLSQKEQAIQGIITPLQQALTKVDTKIQDMEKERVGAYENLKTQVHHLIHSQRELKSETSNLVKALRSPQVRGQWGEMQLKRVVELAGMHNHCDFTEQTSTDTDNGGRLRPDMIINLPGGGKIIVDAKAPLMAYLEALDVDTDEARHIKMQEHARHVRNHIKALSQKAYYEQFSPTPDFVVLFLPGEMFFSAALEQDPELLELGFRDKVILATPTTLIALLRAVAYGWRQESLTENARHISILGQEISKRLSDLGGHVMKLGRSIGHVVENYNQTVGTLERRVLVTARKFKDFDPHAEAIEALSPLSHIPREIHALELTQNSDHNDLIEENNDTIKDKIKNAAHV